MARRSPGRLGLPLELIIVARIIGASLIYLAVLSIAQLVTLGLSLTVVPDPARGTFGLVGLGIAEGAALIAILLAWRLVDRRPIRALGLYRDRPFRRWLTGAAVGCLMMGFVILVGFTLVDGASWSVNSDALRATVALVGGFVGYLIQGPSEEILFRGYMLENIRGRWGVRTAVIVSSVLFALFHAPNPAFGVMPFINLVLFGAATALYKVYLDGNQLWGVFAIHTVWNWLQQVVFGLPNSGIAAVPQDALFTITPNTALPDPFWGGGFGPEGTLAASLVLLALVAASLRQRRRAGLDKTTRRAAMAAGAG